MRPIRAWRWARCSGDDGPPTASVSVAVQAMRRRRRGREPADRQSPLASRRARRGQSVCGAGAPVCRRGGDSLTRFMEVCGRFRHKPLRIAWSKCDRSRCGMPDPAVRPRPEGCASRADWGWRDRADNGCAGAVNAGLTWRTGVAVRRRRQPGSAAPRSGRPACGGRRRPRTPRARPGRRRWPARTTLAGWRRPAGRQLSGSCRLLYLPARLGGVPEWLKGADCKSVGLRLRWFESSLLHQPIAPPPGSPQRELGPAGQAGVVQWQNLSLPS